MKIVKKIDMYMLRNFLGLFFATFFIAVFILLMQFVWMHVQDLVGKGLALTVLAEFFVYAVATVVPLALPLAILLASLISFGNLGERFELTAMKAAGISLFRIMAPLVVFISMVSAGAFFFSNNVLPKAQMKLWALIFSLRQKSPELSIPVGEFYGGIDGLNIYVKQKDPVDGTLFNVMIYNYTNGFDNASVTIADSARLFFTADKKFLVLRLFQGESFENLSSNDKKATGLAKNIPYRRETFSAKQLLLDFDSEFSRYDESVLEDQHVSKNVSELVHSIDSVQQEAQTRSMEQSKQLVETKYFGREREAGKQIGDSLATASARSGKIDMYALYEGLSVAEKKRVAQQEREAIANYSNQVQYNALLLDDAQRYIRRHEIELYRKFTLAFACLIFFFIGAPLGAIIRKGGLGAPVVISVVLFIIYYIIDNTGYKMAREALWPCWAGMWLSSFVLLPVGIFLTYKAATDSALFNPEAWLIGWKKIAAKIKNYENKHNRRSLGGL
jgi:lipopolysaccharide export system permease protein